MNKLNFKITKRNLPHWSLEGATYFITFGTKTGILNEKERIITLQHIQKGNKKFYDLYAAIVMQDHVHIILKPLGIDLNRIMKGIKGVSSRLVNKSRNQSGTIWQPESFDRIIRDENEFLEKMNYIINNPLKDGLANDPLCYPGLYICSE